MKIRSSKTKNKNRNKFLNKKNKIKNKKGELAKTKFVEIGNQKRQN